MDPISVTALVISLLAALGHFLKEVHLKRLKCACIESDCMDEQKIRSKSTLTPPDTPRDHREAISNSEGMKTSV